MNRPLAIQQATTSPDEIAALASVVTDYQQKFCDAKGQRQSDARYQDLRATRQRLAMLFGERHGWRLSKSDFSPSVLARRGLFNGRGYHVDPWPRELVDHGYFYRKDRKAAAVAAHLYGTFDAAKCQDTMAMAALYGLCVTWPEDFPSWYLPGQTTLIICTPLAESPAMMMPPDRIEHWPLARLKPYARNAKTHDADQVAKIAASMAEFGWTVPVLVAADGELIAGHGRILAAAHLGLTEAPVIVLGHLTEAQRRAYRIADNRLTELGGWDEALLLQELQALLAEDFDLGLIGIPEDELDALLHAGDDDAADAIPEPPSEPITRPGDIWALGKHRLCCGDATDPAAVAKLMQNEAATLMFTSPPYAQQRDYGAAKEKVGDWDALMQGVFAAAPVTDDAQVLVNLGLVHRDSEWQPYWEGWVEWMRTSGWRRFGWYVWDQGPGLPGDWNGRLAPSHEFIFHFNRSPRKPHKTVPSKHAGEVLGGGGLRGADGTVHAKTGTGNAIQSHRIPDSVFRIMRHKGGLGAAGSLPAVFPVALVEAVLTAFSDPGDLIYEPFCGSGTQTVAAERAGRRCFAMELDPVYCDVAVRRWEMATGKKAVHLAVLTQQSAACTIALLSNP